MTAAFPAANTLRRALEVLREEGVASFGLKVASALGYRRLILLECSLVPALPQLAPGFPLQFGRLKPSELDDHLAFRPDLSAEGIQDRLRSAQDCFVARHEGRIVSACWAATRSVRIAFLDLELHVAADEVYLFDAFTDPAYRRQGIAVALCLHQLAHYRAQGKRRAIRGTVPENTPALRAHAKSGFRPCALIRMLRLGPWQWTARQPWRSGL